MLIGDDPDRTQCDRGHRCLTQACDQTEPEVVSVNQPVVGQRPKFNRRAAASFNHALQRTRRERRGCKRCVRCAGSLSFCR